MKRFDVLVVDFIVSRQFRMYMKKGTLRPKNYLKLSKEKVVFMDEINLKFLLYKRLEQKFL